MPGRISQPAPRPSRRGSISRARAPSFEDRAVADLTVTRAALERMAGQYLAGAAPTEPLASPLFGDLAGLPPLLIVAGAPRRCSTMRSASPARPRSRAST